MASRDCTLFFAFAGTSIDSPASTDLFIRWGVFQGCTSPDAQMMYARLVTLKMANEIQNTMRHSSSVCCNGGNSLIRTTGVQTDSSMVTQIGGPGSILALLMKVNIQSSYFNILSVPNNAQ